MVVEFSEIGLHSRDWPPVDGFVRRPILFVMAATRWISAC
jgi:hypothetical protein